MRGGEHLEHITRDHHGQVTEKARLDFSESY